ncbi:MAG: LytTR family DNA-binding domain-containing protein [Christensenellaceae bacterium]
MKSYKICVCDDDSSIRRDLKKHILSYSFEYDMDIETIELDNAKNLLDTSYQYDILFLDIRFGNENTGIDIAQKLRQRGNTSIIVLITSLKSMSIDGYRAEPFRFIVKPLTCEHVYNLLQSCIGKLSRTVTYIKVVSDSLSEQIRVDKIIYICSKARKRQIIYGSNNVINTWQSLSELMMGLPPQKFVYAQKSYIVNLDMVSTVKNDKIILVNDIVVPLGSHYKNDFLLALQTNLHTY